MISALVTMLVTFFLIFSKAGKTVIDIPSDRSLHEQPTPRIGGVGLMAGILSGWAIMIRSTSLWIIAPLLILFIVSLIDDIKHLPVAKRLIAHAIAALLFIWGAGLFGQSLWIALLCFLIILWATNLYNFMDGSDGLAGGMTLLGFTAYGIALLMHEQPAQAMLAFSVGAAALGFLYHNFPPAKVFMGDAGSIPLGFLAAALGLHGWLDDAWFWWFPILVFSPFIVDASVTLLKRWAQGKAITEAHREHYYQRLIQMGWKHKHVAAAEYLLMLGALISGLLNIHTELPGTLLMAWAGVYISLMLLIDYHWARRNEI